MFAIHVLIRLKYVNKMFVIYVDAFWTQRFESKMSNVMIIDDNI
uniref:Uncharacterized protein n=1 Tax=CrAss-like virus sp. ctYsL76 TaxID=2826826 RepID=A0A8S5QMQ4_9CAUD|nr:MAG TPA: hypothetical protein [CrAss-like virus sp. ctYsL76]